MKIACSGLECRYWQGSQGNSSVQCSFCTVAASQKKCDYKNQILSYNENICFNTKIDGILCKLDLIFVSFMKVKRTTSPSSILILMK